MFNLLSQTALHFRSTVPATTRSSAAALHPNLLTQCISNPSHSLLHPGICAETFMPDSSISPVPHFPPFQHWPMQSPSPNLWPLFPLQPDLVLICSHHHQPGTRFTIWILHCHVFQRSPQVSKLTLASATSHPWGLADHQCKPQHLWSQPKSHIVNIGWTVVEIAAFFKAKNRKIQKFIPETKTSACV